MWEKRVGADKEALRTVDRAKAFREPGPQPRDDQRLTHQSQHRMGPRARYTRRQQSGSLSLFREEQETRETRPKVSTTGSSSSSIFLGVELPQYYLVLNGLSLCRRQIV